MPPGTVKNIIFDLDGTLVDSLPGIEESTRVAISRVMPGLPMPDLRAVIGPPVAAMFAKLWPGMPLGERLLAEFRTHYDETGCLLSQPYAGVSEILPRLQAAGLRLFLLTNKPYQPTRGILAHLGLGKYFTDIATPDFPERFESKPAGARMLASKFGLSPDGTVLVGDGVDDAASAAECGFTFIAAAYGYGSAATNASIRLEKFSDIEYHLSQFDSRL